MARDRRREERWGARMLGIREKSTEKGTGAKMERK